MKMQDAVKEGKSFLEYIRTLHPRPHKTEFATLQIRFEQTQDLMKMESLVSSHPSEQVHSHEQFIVVQANGWPLTKDEKLRSKIHSNRKSAEQFGKDYYPERFKIIPYMVFIHTAQGKDCKRLQQAHATMQAILTKRKRKQKIKIKPKKVSVKISKGKQDSITYYQHLLNKAEIACNFTEMIRLKAQIKKLK
jgi:hypothetical protein